MEGGCIIALMQPLFLCFDEDSLYASRKVLRAPFYSNVSSLSRRFAWL